MTESGRELDAEVADKVMGQVACDGWKLVNLGSAGGPAMMTTDACPHERRAHQCYPSGDGWPGQGAPHYSTDIAAAWTVADHLAGQRIGNLIVVAVDVSIGAYDQSEPPYYTCCFTLATPEDAPPSQPTTFDGIDATADTAPLAICRAALRAVEG